MRKESNDNTYIEYSSPDSLKNKYDGKYDQLLKKSMPKSDIDMSDKI
jgi:hypothetical protein